jgi:hypothetical protein
MGMPILGKRSKLLKLFTQTDKVDAKPTGGMMNVSVHYLIHLCFSNHPLVLGTFQQFFSSSA